MFKIDDIVFVSNPDKAYEEEWGAREHKAFFGRVTEVEEFESGTTVQVKFPATPNGTAAEWCYYENELSHASELKNMTLEDFSNRYGVSVNAEYV